MVIETFQSKVLKVISCFLMLTAKVVSQWAAGFGCFTF